MPTEEKILLDTNFLMIPGNFGVDVFTEIERICNFKYKLYILDKSLDELKKLPEKAQKHKTTTKRAVNVALKLVENMVQDGKLNIIPIKTNNKLLNIYKDKYVDDILKEVKNEYIIATTDKELKKHLKRVIVLRQKSHLELVNYA